MFSDAEKCLKALVLKEKWLKLLSVVRLWRPTGHILTEMFPHDKRFQEKTFNSVKMNCCRMSVLCSGLSDQWSTCALTDRTACSNGKVTEWNAGGFPESSLLYNNSFLKCISSVITSTIHDSPTWIRLHLCIASLYNMLHTLVTVQKRQ